MKRDRKSLTGKRKPSEQRQHAILEYEEHRAVERNERHLRNYSREFRGSSQFLESIIENANVWLNVLDERKNVVIWNKAAETISGYSRQEVVGHGKIWEWLYPDQQYRNEVTDSVTEILQQGRVEQDVETSIRRQDGEIRVISWNERNLLGEHSEVIGSIAIGQDVTERKRAEEALRESEERYRMIFQNSPLGIFRSTLDGRFLEVNPSLSKILGYDSPETVIREIHDIAKQIYVRAEDRHRIVAEQLGSDEVTHHLNCFRRKDGSEFSANLYLKTVRDAEGRPIFLEGIVEDITERKRMQEELEHYSKQLQESQEKLRALHKHALQLGSASNIDEIVKSTLDAIEFALGFDVADVYIAAEDSLRVRGVRGAPTGVSEERLSGRGLVAKAARTQATVRVSDTAKEPDYVDRKGWDWTGPHTMLSELAVPVVVDGQTVAVLNAESIRPDAFSSEDQRLLETLAAHVGSGMQRQKHTHELETYSKHLEELVEERTEKLRQSEERYRSIVQNVPGMVWTSSEKGDTVFITPNVKELYGYTPEEIYADGEQAWSRHLHPDDRGKANEAYKRLFSDGSVFDVEYRYQRPDGKWLWLNDRADSVYEKDGVRYTDGVTTDITERKRTEEALRASEERFRELADLLPEIVYEIDNQGYFTFVNRSGLTLLGYTGEEIHKGLNAIQVFAEKDQDRVRENIKRILAGQDLGVNEYAAKRRDGSIFPVIIHSNRILKEAMAVGMRGIVVDISERKRMEEALRVSEERFRGIAERSIDGIFELDLVGRVMYVSPSVEPGFGYKPGEVTGTRMEQYFPEFEIPKIAQNWAALMEGRNVIGLQAEMLRKDGTRFSAELNASPIFKDEKIVGVQGILRDITERAKMENALRESEQRYRRLFESSPVPLWEEDFSEVKKYFDDLRSGGVRDLRRHFTEHPEDLDKCASMVKILNVNESTLRLYETKSVEELTGKLNRVLTPDSQDRFREELIALSEGKTRFASEFDNQTLTGDVRHVSLILNVVPGHEDTLAKVLISTIDLTERKKMEQRLQQAERLAAVGETAAMVGHDLRNPLQGITGALHLLKQESLTAEERDEMLQLIQESVHYSDAIVRDLTEYSTEIHLEPTETAPKSIIRDAVRAVRIPEKITLHDSSQEHPIIMVDQDRMRRVIVNIIENAIDAMPQGGTLTVSSERFNGNVEIDVSDTGAGMPEKIMQNLWKPLQTTKAKGLGLGLPICKRIVDAHGGTISVDSKAGQGTTVTIRLPLNAHVAEVNEK